MDSLLSLSWLLPVWIIGAPLLLALINLMTTPKRDYSTSHRDERDHAVMQAPIVGRHNPVMSR